jgi:SNF2 family DNA or RNA helicase
MAAIERDGDVIVVNATFSEKELVKQVPGSAWSSRDHRWTVPLSWAACLQLRALFTTNLDIGPQLTEWSWGEAARIKMAMDIREDTGNGRARPPGQNQLFPFQDVDVEFTAVAGNALISHEMGLGKTITALASLKTHANLPALVICPNTTKTGWFRQTQTWYPEAHPYVISGSAIQRRKLLAEAKKDPKALVIINIEAVRMFSRLAPFGSIRLAKCSQCDPSTDRKPSVCEVHRRELNDFGFKTIILDEAHRIKDPKSKQTRACWAVGHDASVERRWALTGTPIANHIGDLWSVMHFVEPIEYATKSKFVDRYALVAWNAFGGLDIVGVNPATRDEFQKIFHPRFRRMLKVQVREQLPIHQRSQVWVEMGPKQAKAYKEIESQLITLIDDEPMTVPNNLTKMMRLLQLASSYADIEWVNVPDKCRNPKHDLEPDRFRRGSCTCCFDHQELIVHLAEPSPKLDALEELLDGTDKPVIIAAESKQLIMLAAKRFDKNRKNEPYGLITGDQDEWERDKAIKQLQHGDLRAILMTIGAGGTGVDGLQAADTMIFLQRSWSMVNNIQAEARIDRIGSTSDSVHYIDIICRDTVEERKQHPALAAKFTRLDEITQDRARLAALGQTSHELELEVEQLSGGFIL